MKANDQSEAQPVKHMATRVWIAIGGLAGLVACISVTFAGAQLWQSASESKAQNLAHATVVTVLEAQYRVQSEIAALQASNIATGSTATAVAQELAQLESTVEALEQARQEAEATLTPVTEAYVATATPLSTATPVTLSQSAKATLSAKPTVTSAPSPTNTPTATLATPTNTPTAEPLPRTCQEIRDQDPNALDGTYTLHLDGLKSAPYTVHCRNMVRAPMEYLPLANIGEEQNYSRFAAGGARGGTDVVTRFAMIRFDPLTLQVDTSDLTFTNSSGSIRWGHNVINQMPYGEAASCINNYDASGTANIDLRGTPFGVDSSSEFKVSGYLPNGSTSFNFQAQVVHLTGGGYCGSNKATLLKLYYLGPVSTPTNTPKS